MLHQRSGKRYGIEKNAGFWLTNMPEGARLPVSVPMIAIGLAAAAWSAYHFLKVKGTPITFNPPQHLSPFPLYFLLFFSKEIIVGVTFPLVAPS